MKNDGVPAMSIIRPYEERDNSRLLEVQKLCPHGDEKQALGADRKSDIIARYRMYDNWKVLVAEEEGAMAGWIGWTVKRDPQQKPYVYLSEVMIHPDFRKMGIATMLIGAAERATQDAGADHIYCYIYEANRASKSLFERLGYREVLQAKQCSKSAFKKAGLQEGSSIARISGSDLPEAVGLINDFNSGRLHFLPFSPGAFEARLSSIPGYGRESIWAAKDGGRIVACAGLWDISALEEVYYAREPLQYRILGKLFGILGHLVKLPRIPAQGERFKLLQLVDHAFLPQAAEAMAGLLGHLNNLLLERGDDAMLTLLAPDDPLLDVFKRLKPQVESWSVYAKPLDGELPGFHPYYVDIRDTIL